MGSLDAADCKRIEKLLERAGLPTRASGVDPDALLEGMRGDKKADQAGLKLILIEALGHAVVTQAPAEAALRAVLAEQLAMTEARNELAIYAARASTSRGRRYPEPPPALRTEFQRDRDRVIHATAFRRLVYKTQVFVNYEGDLYRTRLTHSLEVAQIARTVARALQLNEDLVEAISLAHDLGHTPFGHAGQDALNDCMRDYGGFEHNLQSLRVVDQLEDRYASFPGLNLTFETREGILKHCSLKHARELGDVGKRFLERRQPGLEAQLANIADEIAYNNHDVDDGLRSGLITLEQLSSLPFFAEHLQWVDREFPGQKPQRRGSETVRRMIGELVADLVEHERRCHRRCRTAAHRRRPRSCRSRWFGSARRCAKRSRR